MDSQLAPSGFSFRFLSCHLLSFVVALSPSVLVPLRVDFVTFSGRASCCGRGSLRSCLDRPWRREAPLFLLEVSGPSLLSFEAPSFATGLEGCPAAPPSAGGVRTGVLQSAGHTRPMICKALLVMALCSFSIYVFIRCFPCRLKGSFLLSFLFGVSGTSRRTGSVSVLRSFPSAPERPFPRCCRRRRRRRRF